MERARNDRVPSHLGRLLRPRYLDTWFAGGLAYVAHIHNGVIFYTRTLDPFGLVQLQVGSSERFARARTPRSRASARCSRRGRCGRPDRSETVNDPAISRHARAAHIK